MTDAFKQMFSGVGYLRIANWDVDFSSLDEISSFSLEAPFTEENIFSSLKEVDGDKAPGPDGFSFSFIKTYWHLFKPEMLALFNTFHTYGEFNSRHSEFFIALIPK